MIAVARRLPLALVLVLAAGFAVGAAVGAPVVPARPDGRAAGILAGDFVEVGPLGSGVGRSQAVVQLVNESGSVLDVVLGEGSATLQPKDVMLARAAPGEVTLTAKSRTDAADTLEGKLRVEAGRRYVLAFLRVSPEELEAGEATPTSAAAADPAAEGVERRAEPPRTRKGRVDIGRRRR